MKKLLCGFLTVALLCHGAAALEAPRAAGEVEIPVAAEGVRAVAGVEFAVRYSAGLRFERFVRSELFADAELVTAVRGDIVYIGLFAYWNMFVPENGRLTLGELYFAYDGADEERVSVADCTIYTVGDEGIRAGESRAGDSAVTVTRAPESPGGASPSPGGGNSGGGTGGGRPGGNAPADARETEELLLTEGEIALGELPEPIVFSDLDGVEWAREAIEYLAAHKGILGMGGGIFNPNGTVTRAQFARFVAQSFSIEAGGESAAFTDVSEDAWYFADVRTLASNGILNGYGDGTFGPEDEVTREQMAAILARALAVLGVETPETRTFALSDLEDAAPYAREAITSLYCAGIINGMDGGVYAPKGRATRAQVCVLLYRALPELRL
jgi:hypothetical protein